MPKKLPGRYKGTRRRTPPPTLIIIECPGCGWKSFPDPPELAEKSYLTHLTYIHYGYLQCYFCPSYLPDFATLAYHVRLFHPEVFRDDGLFRNPENFPGCRKFKC
jgi:hypothetical protein